MTILGRLAALGVALCLLWGTPAHPQPYPSKPICIICAFPVGGIADLYARIIGQRVTEGWAQPVVVENRTGAGSPEVQARLPGEGARFVPNTPEQFGEFVKAEIAKWAPVVKASGARIN